MNYQATLKIMCKKKEKREDKPTLENVSVRGIMVDISKRTINRFLHGPDFTSQVTSPTFYYQLKDHEK